MLKPVIHVMGFCILGGIEMVNQKLVAAVKLSGKRGYRIAHEAGLHPTTLSRILTGAERVKSNDVRVLAVAEVLGMKPDDCFTMSQDEA